MPEQGARPQQPMADTQSADAAPSLGGKPLALNVVHHTVRAWTARRNSSGSRARHATSKWKSPALRPAVAQSSPARGSP